MRILYEYDTQEYYGFPVHMNGHPRASAGWRVHSVVYIPQNNESGRRPEGWLIIYERPIANAL